MVTIIELVATGKYDEKAISKFYAKQLKLNDGAVNVAEAMVRIYLHTFEIREPRICK